MTASAVSTKADDVMTDTEIAQQCYESMWRDDLASRDLGMTVAVTEPGSARAEFEIRENMVNGHGLCHGGYIFTLADSAFAFACNSYNRVTVAAGASIEFVRPARLGDKLVATAKELSRGGRTGIYDVTVSNQDNEVVAIFRGRSYSTREPVIPK
jgi:acyl-CoA thioesterase